MVQSARMTAEARFTATQKKSEIALSEKEKVRKEKSEQVARLKALRLRKETADKKAANKAEAETNAPDLSSAQTLPQAHRRRS
jgi:hypothetical protein